MRSKRCKGCNGLEVVPPTCFHGGYDKKCKIFADYIASPLFRVKKSVYSEKNVFGQSFFGLMSAKISALHNFVEIGRGQLNFEPSPDSANLRTPKI